MRIAIVIKTAAPLLWLRLGMHNWPHSLSGVAFLYPAQLKGVMSSMSVNGRTSSCCDNLKPGLEPHTHTALCRNSATASTLFLVLRTEFREMLQQIRV